MAYLISERADMRPKRTNLRFERVKLRPEMPTLRPEKLERLDLMLEG